MHELGSVRLESGQKLGKSARRSIAVRLHLEESVVVGHNRISLAGQRGSDDMAIVILDLGWHSPKEWGDIANISFGECVSHHLDPTPDPLRIESAPHQAVVDLGEDFCAPDNAKQPVLSESEQQVCRDVRMQDIGVECRGIRHRLLGVDPKVIRIPAKLTQSFAATGRALAAIGQDIVQP